MRQAITVKYFGPTNSRDRRLQASCAARVIYLDWDDSRNLDDNSESAARTLVELLGWEGELIGGVCVGGEYVFVLREVKS